MTEYLKAIRKLVEAMIKEGNATTVEVVCVEDDQKFPVDRIDLILDYAESVDDVTGIIAYKKDTKLGWFGIEPENEDILDIIYDYTDNDYCAGIMEQISK